MWAEMDTPEGPAGGLETTNTVADAGASDGLVLRPDVAKETTSKHEDKATETA